MSAWTKSGILDTKKKKNYISVPFLREVKILYKTISIHQICRPIILSFGLNLYSLVSIKTNNDFEYLRTLENKILQAKDVQLFE